MKIIWLRAVLGAISLFGLHFVAQEHAAQRKPLTFELDCAGGDCPLLKGTPQTSGMRGGSVRLKPGESVGWHSTGQNEEALAILQGNGTANIEGQADVLFQARTLVYIPPDTRHNVTNTGNQILEYVWVVAPVRAK
jgi:mannose-6-phosphate isomerase-like protein (cupin superfamily)